MTKRSYEIPRESRRLSIGMGLTLVPSGACLRGCMSRGKDQAVHEEVSGFIGLSVLPQVGI